MSAENSPDHEVRIAALENNVRRVRAVMFGTEDDELGGIVNDIYEAKTSLKALKWMGGIIIAFLSPETLKTISTIISGFMKP